MFYQHNMGAGGWIFMALGNIIIWGLIIAFIVWLARDLRTRPHRHHITSGASASEILDRRLASGEINPEQYQRLRATLATQSGDSPRATGRRDGPRNDSVSANAGSGLDEPGGEPADGHTPRLATSGSMEVGVGADLDHPVLPERESNISLALDGRAT